METNQHDDGVVAGDLLVGGEAVLRFFIEMGILPPDAVIADLYYLKRTGRWAIGNTAGDDGGKLIISKRRVARQADKIARGPPGA